MLSATEQVAAVLLAMSLLGLGYIYVGYPLLVVAGSRLFPRRVAKQPATHTVSIVLSAFNERERIVRRIENLLASDYADHIEQILIGSDGSTDGMPEVIAQYPDARVSCVACPERRGKPSVLNDLVARATAPIVIMCDARQTFAPQSIRKLVENLQDPAIAVVSGELILTDGPHSTTAATGVGFYWKYEKLIRKAEARFRGVPGATGACYAIRRALFRPIPAETILDDVMIPMQAQEHGGRCVFEPEATAYDQPSQSTAQESIRKRRTIAGNVQLLQLKPQWLWPWSNPLWFEFMSHKILRLASPVLLGVALLSNVWLCRTGWGQALLVTQAVFYCAAAWGALAQQLGRRSRWSGPMLMFCSLNWTTGLALWDALRGRYRVTWQRSAGA